MRTIKFRGRVPNTDKHNGGRIVYGDLVQWGGFEEGRICSWENGVIYDVDEDSIAQLVGYDRNGNEVYEGDEIISVHGVTATATFLGNLLEGDTLKEAGDNGGA